MARSESRTLTSIWDDDDFLALPPVQKAVYWVLTSQPDVAHCGVMPLRVGRWARKFGVTTGQFQAALDGLAVARFIVIDIDLEELLIRTFIRNDGVYKQPNVLRAAQRAMVSVSSPVIRDAQAIEVERLLKEFSESVPEGSKRVLEAMLHDLSKSSGTVEGTLREGFPEGFAEGTHESAGDRGKGKNLKVRTSKASSDNETQAKKTQQPPRPDVDKLCTALVDHRVRLNCKPPSITQEWRDEARRLFDIDKRTLADALGLLAWSQDNAFWRANIKSIPKFRSQFDTLRLQRETETTDRRGPSSDRQLAATDERCPQHSRQPKDACGICASERNGAPRE